MHFIGIGAQKAGTTWLFASLAAHPQSTFPAGKEVHFWDRSTRAEEWLALMRPERPTLSDGRAILAGDITPSYALLSTETIASIFRACPEARLFYSVRNPIDRAWSAALMAMDRAQLDFAEASDAFFLDIVRSQRSRARGAYCDAVARWTEVFPPEQLKIICYDDLRIRPRQVLIDLAQHLGVDAQSGWPPPDSELHRIVLPAFDRSSASRAVCHLRERPAVLEALRSLYADEIRRVGSELGIDVTNWMEPANPLAGHDAAVLRVGRMGSAIPAHLLNDSAHRL